MTSKWPYISLGDISVTHINGNGKMFHKNLNSQNFQTLKNTLWEPMRYKFRGGCKDLWLICRSSGVFSSAWLYQQSSWNLTSSVVRRPSSVCGIDYLRSYCMDLFQIQLWRPMGYMPRRFFFIILFFFYFLRIFFVFVNMGTYGSQNFKTLLLPQITFESFQTLSEISSQWSSQKYCFGFLKF